MTKSDRVILKLVFGRDLEVFGSRLTNTSLTGSRNWVILVCCRTGEREKSMPYVCEVKIKAIG